MKTSILSICSLAGILMLASCSDQSLPTIITKADCLSPAEAKIAIAKIKELNKTDDKGKYINPFQPYTYTHFVARQDYPKTTDVFVDPAAFENKDGKKMRVIVCLKEQRARLYYDDDVVMDTPVATGVPGHSTPTGQYKVMEKKSFHSSNLYGTAYSAEGKVVGRDVGAGSQPEGGRYVGSPMPYWHRLTGSGIGMHVGKIGKRPASHGCIRMPKEGASRLYKVSKIGLPVSIVQEPETNTSLLVPKKLEI